MSTILLVDDDPAIRRLLTRMLESNYEILETDNGSDAVSIVKCRRPEIVLLNLEMPGIDGLETCRRLKKLPIVAQPVVIVLSAMVDVATRNSACMAGADDFISKPVQRNQLLSRIRLHQQCLDRFKLDRRVIHAAHAACSVEGDAD